MPPGTESPLRETGKMRLTEVKADLGSGKDPTRVPYFTSENFMAVLPLQVLQSVQTTHSSEWLPGNEHIVFNARSFSVCFQVQVCQFQTAH